MEYSASDPARQAKPACTFGKFRLEPDGTLIRGGKRLQLAGTELAMLRLLIERRGKLVTNAELGREIGSGAHITSETVAQAIASLRQRLGPEEHIQQVPKRGFRFISNVVEMQSAPSGVLPHVAFLPLTAEYGVAEYMGTAVAEAAMDDLGRSQPAVCTLAAKESVATLAKRGLSPLEIGRAMHADMVLTGSLRALPAHHRMRIEMIDVKHGRQLWTEDVLVERAQHAGLETELARLITLRTEGGEISISATAESESGQQSAPQHREAYELYQRARFEWQSLERHRMQDAVQHLTRASEIDPSFVAARIDLAHLAITEAFHGYLAPSVAVDMVRRASRQGIDFADAAAMLPAIGWVNFHYDRNLPAAVDAFKRSSHLSHDPWITRARLMLALSRKRFDEAIGLIRDALTLDPYSGWLHARLAWAHHLMGDASESVRLIKAALDQFPMHEGIELYAGIILSLNRDFARAEEVAAALAHRRPYFDLATAVHAYTLAVAGNSDEARALLERMEWMGRERYVMNSLSPAVYVALGDHEQALAELAAANQARCPWFFQALADPRLTPLHDNPEFLQYEQILVDMERAAGDA
ncbi:MAG TPA: tetratricopeptide repeat protein [Terracidiphilus sp.]|nr:tetratricopeptide repeat protein [Terracidiphilus sp.]